MMTSSKQTNRLGDKRGLHPNSLANLNDGKQPGNWKPGQSGNPPGQSVSARAKGKLNEVCPFDAQGRIWGDVLPETLLRQALNSTMGMRELLDRTEGKVTDTHEVKVEAKGTFEYITSEGIKLTAKQLAEREG